MEHIQTAPIVQFDHVTKTFEPGNQPALRDISFEVRNGEFLCLVGPSGEGKSTTLKLIAGLEEPTSGTVYRPARVSMAFQTVALMPWLSVLDNVLLGLRSENMSPEVLSQLDRKVIAGINQWRCSGKR